MNRNFLAAVSAPTDFKSLVQIFLSLILSLLPILAGLSLLAFIYGIILFIWKSGDANTHAEGRRFMTWGIIALFVMISFMGLIQIVYNDLGFSVRGLGVPLLPDGSAPLGTPN